MKKLILIGIGIAGAAAFVGFDAVEAFVDKTRADVRSKLISPEVELQASISEAKELAERCAQSVVDGRVALARLDSMITERERELGRRDKALAMDRRVLETRRTLLQQERAVYLIGREEVSRKTLNRDAMLRAKAYTSDKEIYDHLGHALGELKAQRSATAAEIEDAVVEQRRLEGEITALNAELENLKARRAVAQTRDEAAYLFDRSTFDNARDKVSEIRAKIAEQNMRLNTYGTRAHRGKGLIPDGEEVTVEDGLDAITTALGEAELHADDEDAPVVLPATR
jgi:DNA repair exonuclease SbcCD ATPase subunit